jgi:hypothetical protein
VNSCLVIESINLLRGPSCWRSGRALPRFPAPRSGNAHRTSLLSKRGTRPVILNRSNRKRPFSFAKRWDRERHRVDAFCRLKDFRRIATRYDRLDATSSPRSISRPPIWVGLLSLDPSSSAANVLCGRPLGFKSESENSDGRSIAIMCPGCWRGIMTAGPDGFRNPAPNSPAVSEAGTLNGVLWIVGSTDRHLTQLFHPGTNARSRG